MKLCTNSEKFEANNLQNKVELEGKVYKLNQE